MKVIFGILAITNIFIFLVCYEINQNIVNDKLNDFLGIFGYIAMFVLTPLFCCLTRFF